MTQWEAGRNCPSVLCNLSEACSFPSSVNTLSTGNHTDSQHKLFWKRHGGLMHNFCPKYGSFAVVMPLRGNGILCAWHLPKAALTHGAKCQDKGYRASSLLPQWDKPQESRRLALLHATARDVFHWPPRVRMRGVVHRLGCPLSCQLPSKTCLWSWYCQPSETGLHKMFISAKKLKLVLTRFSSGILQQG